MQQARPANAVECKAEVGLRAIAVRMGVLSNGTLHLTTVYWQSRREFRPVFDVSGTVLIISTIPLAAGEFCCKWSKLPRAFVDCSRETNIRKQRGTFRDIVYTLTGMCRLFVIDKICLRLKDKNFTLKIILEAILCNMLGKIL